jgi:hypothetical protein
MYGIDLGVTPPGTIRKMNQDNNCLFNANPWMNLDTFMYDIITNMIMIMIMFSNENTYD